MKAPRGARLASISLGLIVGALVVEAALRYFGYPGASQRADFVLSTVYGDVPRDSWIFRLPESDPAEVLEINSELVPLGKKPGEKRILFLGDSGTYGLGAGFRNSYPIQLGRELGKLESGRAARIINAGVIGLTTVNELQLFERHLRKLKPDVVILGLFMANDINFNLMHERSHPLLSWSRNHSALVHFSTLSLLALNSRARWAALDGLTAIDSDGFEFFSYVTGELALYRKTSSALTNRSFDLLEKLLSRFRELSVEDGFHLGVLLIPTRSTLSGKLDMGCCADAPVALRDRGFSEEDLDFGLPTRRVLATCARLGISCIDPSAELRALGPEKAVLPKDDHPTTEGHRVLGETLLRAIRTWL